MQIDFERIENTAIPGFKGGDGVTEARMFFDGNSRIMICRIKPRSSIGVHTHETSSEVMFFISGHGKAVCDGVEEIIRPGVAHFCPRGSTHTVVNTGDDDLVMYAAVTEFKQ